MPQARFDATDSYFTVLSGCGPPAVPVGRIRSRPHKPLGTPGTWPESASQSRYIHRCHVRSSMRRSPIWRPQAAQIRRNPARIQGNPVDVWGNPAKHFFGPGPSLARPIPKLVTLKPRSVEADPAWVEPSSDVIERDSNLFEHDPHLAEAGPNWEIHSRFGRPQPNCCRALAISALEPQAKVVAPIPSLGRSRPEGCRA